MADEHEDQGMVAQDWLHSLYEKWRARAVHAFVLSGNVFDYVGRTRSGSQYFSLDEALMKFFDRATRHAFVLHLRPGFAGAAGAGLSFASQQMEERFRRLLAAANKKAGGEKHPPQTEPASVPNGAESESGPAPQAVSGEQTEADADEHEWRVLHGMNQVHPRRGRRNPQNAGVSGGVDSRQEANLVMDLPVPLREVYINFSEEKKELVRALKPADRIQFVLDEHRHGDMDNPAAKDKDGDNGPPDFALPQNPRDIWRFIAGELFALTLGELEELLPGERGRFRAPAALVVHRPELLLASGPGGHLSDDERVLLGTFMALAQDEDIRARGNIIVFVSGDDKLVPEQMLDPAQGFEVLDIPYHEDKERKVFAERLPSRLEAKVPKENRASDKPLTLPEGMGAAEFAAGPTAGLRLVDLEALGAEELVRAEAGEIPRFSLDAIWERKRVYLERRSGKQISVKRPMSKFEWIGGHDQAKKYFLLIAERLRRGETARIPKGILLVGPPGTGKTVLCQALATVTGYSYAEIRNEKDPFVGMSTRNRARNRGLILSLAPVVVFEDEFESKHLPRGAVWHGDSGVTAEMDAMEREFFADDARRGKVVWIAATNRPDQIESAMIRPGRFDRIIPILPPKSEEGWVKVFLGVARKMTDTYEGVRWDVPDDALREIVATGLPEGITQGHINEFCYRAIHFADTDGRITPEILQQAIADYPVRPDKEYERQIKLALQFANSNELVPAEWRVGVPVEEVEPRPRATIVSQVYENPPDGPDKGPAGEGGTSN